MLVTFDNIKTFYNILVQKIKGSRGNWNQNNPNADDYIKNRPFYSEVKEENLILVNNLTSDSNNWPKCNFVPGQFYNITWNGILYSDVLCHTDGEYNILGDVDNYPFYINDDGGDGLYIDSQDEAWTVSISCSVIQEVVHKLDKKFVDMPDMPEGIVTSDELAQVAFDGDYYSLINTPTVYTKDEVIANYVQMKNNTIALPSSSNWQSVTYGDGKFVAVCVGSDIVAYSEDGMTWVKTYLPLSSSWYSVTYGNGKFVAVCNGSRAAAYSEDGMTWVKTYLPSSSSWQSVTYGNGKFVAVCYGSNAVTYSKDGITWVETHLPFDGSCSAVTYGDGKFVAVCYGSDIAAYSEDGNTWVKTYLPLSSNWQSVTYGDGKFVAVCNGSSAAAYSEDGITWVRNDLPFSANWYSVTYGNGKFVSMCRGSNHPVYSEDGITWVKTYLPSTENWSAVTYGDGKFVAVCYGSKVVAYSKNGITWTRTYKIPTQNGVKITPEQLGFKEPDLTGYATTEQLDNVEAKLLDNVEAKLQDTLYRKLTGVFIYNRHIESGNTCYCVETLPEIGEAVTTDMKYMTAYYNMQDGIVYGYINDALSAHMNVPVGWHTFEVLAAAVGRSWSGVITNMNDDPCDNSNRLLLQYKVYYLDKNTQETLDIIGRSGDSGAEVFNSFTNVATGYYSHAEGHDTTASGSYSHAEGHSTTAQGVRSHAEGYDTTASGYNSHAEGQNTTASGEDSHAEGNYTIASGFAQHVQGKYNIEDTNNQYAHIVGNGSHSARSNAHTLDWDGNAWFAGDVYIGSTSGINKDEGSKKLATEEYVDNKLFIDYDTILAFDTSEIVIDHYKKAILGQAILGKIFLN